jgi:hypothetical protein
VAIDTSDNAGGTVRLDLQDTPLEHCASIARAMTGPHVGGRALAPSRLRVDTRSQGVEAHLQ